MRRACTKDLFTTSILWGIIQALNIFVVCSWFVIHYYARATEESSIYVWSLHDEHIMDIHTHIQIWHCLFLVDDSKRELLRRRPSTGRRSIASLVCRRLLHDEQHMSNRTNIGNMLSVFLLFIYELEARTFKASSVCMYNLHKDQIMIDSWTLIFFLKVRLFAPDDWLKGSNYHSFWESGDHSEKSTSWKLTQTSKFSIVYTW